MVHVFCNYLHWFFIVSNVRIIMMFVSIGYDYMYRCKMSMSYRDSFRERMSVIRTIWNMTFIIIGLQIVSLESVRRNRQRWRVRTNAVKIRNIWARVFVEAKKPDLDYSIFGFCIQGIQPEYSGSSSIIRTPEINWFSGTFQFGLSNCQTRVSEFGDQH